MLDHLIYGAIGFLLGGMLGGAIVGRLVTDDMKKRMDNLEDENRDLRKEIAELKDEKFEEKKKNVEKLEKETDLEEYESLRKRYVSNDIEGEDDFEVDLDETDNETKIEHIEVKDRSDEIKRISEQQFNEEVNYREKCELIYFQEDSTMIDENKDVIINEENVVGSEIMDIIEDTKNDYLYALDDEKDIVYQITVEHEQSYMRDFMGIGDE